ncbi:PepSY domain-containing protein [Jiangella asiatica]|uniref:Uncharacterized protein n=1 Tax=Jiangella asiatica TaxID=2530372 RepID=A0A4R5DHU7_9ACTN|nr:PepSY domain-containing protein [Jiangella asiatica]TDE11501.1 hypothetical protein E1269_09585 [Jiangella asiatica]
MKHLKALIGAVAAAVAAVAGGVAAMGAGAGDDGEAPITGDALRRASEAALEHTGAGTVTNTEIADEEGYFEVEVTLDGGRQLDVHLDQDFTVLSDAPDGTGDGDD